MATEGKEAIPALRAAQKDEVLLVSLMAVAALGRMGKDAVPALLDVLPDHRDRTLHLDVLKALGRIGPEAASAVPSLLKTLHDPREDDYYDSIRSALRKIDPKAAKGNESLLASG